MEPVHEIDYKEFKIKIFPDTSCCEGPREWDNLGTMICFHKRYDLGDKHDMKSSDFNSWDEVEAHLIKEFKAFIILPLYLYDHSGITMRTYPFECRWDSGQVGFIYITKEKIRQESRRKRVTKELIEKYKNFLIGEVETYDTWIRGEVYGYVIEGIDGNEFESCWGFYGLETCVDEAKIMVDYEVAA